MKNKDEPTVPRRAASAVRAVRSAAQTRGNPAASQATYQCEYQEAIQAISIDGKLAERYFAVTSEAPKKYR